MQEKMLFRLSAPYFLSQYSCKIVFWERCDKIHPVLFFVNALQSLKTQINHSVMYLKCCVMILVNLWLSFYQFSSKYIDNYFKMLQKKSQQINQGFLQFQNQFCSRGGAFQPTNPQMNYSAQHQMLNFLASQKSNNKNQRQLSYKGEDKTLINDAEMWSRAQIEKLFKLYDYYGPQWKIMSQQMPSRTANNLKNRFYTVLRNLIKLLFRKKPESCPKLPGQIPSKDLSRLYDGKQDYEVFKSFIPTLLQEIKYDLQSQNIEIVVRKYSQEIVRVYQVIYGERIANQDQEAKKNVNKTAQRVCSLFPTASSLNCREKQYEVMNKIPFLSIKQSSGNTEIVQQPPGYVCVFFINPSDFYSQQRI